MISVGYGEFYDMEFVDGFSVNSSIITEYMVNAIHNRGKEILCVDDQLPAKNPAYGGLRR